MAINTDPTDLLQQDRDAEAFELKARERRRREMEDLRWLLGHPQGRRLVSRLLAEAGVFRSSFNHSGSLMAFNEGKRHVGLWLTGELMEANADGYMRVLKEFKAQTDE